MNLNHKAATTAAVLTTLATLALAISSGASAQTHSPWIHHNPISASASDSAADPASTTTSPETVLPSLGQNQQNWASSTVVMPNSHGNPFDETTGNGEPTSPFVHSDPRAVAPFPILLNRAVKDYVDSFLDQPQGLRLAFQRSRPFLSEMIKVMKDQGIPDDLVYLTFAESDFSKRGKGPWQFTADTAVRFGLRVNKWVDERRDPILSTRAAAEYLAKLHDQADNDWRVALVAWNTGAGNLERYWSLQGTNYNKFVDLLPRRTRQLLNRFMAVAFIAHNASQYGIDEVSYTQKPSWTVRSFKGGTLLKTIAQKLATPVAKLRELNPALRSDRIPPNERAYAVRIPITAGLSD